MIYGYARISKKGMSIERQIRNIKKEYPKAHIIEEVFTGTTTERKEFKKLLNTVKSGDVIIFDSVSRMSRNAAEGFEVYEDLFNKGVKLIFLKEQHINTDVFKKAIENSVEMTGTNIDFILDGVNKYLMALAKEQIIIAFEQAEKEVADLHQRTVEGIETARLNGKQIGRAEGTKIETKKAKKAKEDIIKYSKDFYGSLADSDVITLTGISRKTYYKYKKELKAAL